MAMVTAVLGVAYGMHGMDMDFFFANQNCLSLIPHHNSLSLFTVYVVVLYYWERRLSSGGDIARNNNRYIVVSSSVQMVSLFFLWWAA